MALVADTALNHHSLPVDETKDTLAAAASDLRDMFMEYGKGGPYQELMQKTYSLQRHDILSGADIGTLQKDWPYLFLLGGLWIHFEELTGIKIREEMETTHFSRVKRILAWMRAQETREMLRLNMDLKMAKTVAGNDVAELPAAILTAMTFFKEKSEALFQIVEVISHYYY